MKKKKDSHKFVVTLHAETSEQLLDRFVSSRPANPAISEDEIMDEVRACTTRPEL